jgi:hypothetical protein
LVMRLLTPPIRGYWVARSSQVKPGDDKPTGNRREPHPSPRVEAAGGP